MSTHDTCRQFVQGLEMAAPTLEAEFESAEVAEPAHRPFHNIARFAQTAAVRCFFAVASKQRADAHGDDGQDDRRHAVGTISLENFGTASDFAVAARDRGNAAEHRQGLPVVALVGRAGVNHQGQAIGVGNQVSFAPIFAAIGGVGTCMAPPKSARTDAESITARERLILPLWPKSRSNRRKSLGQTPASVHSLSHRQQVVPLPQPISAGNICQGMPLRKTKTIPSRHLRSAIGGRPPLGRRECFGNNASICSHNWSVTSERAMLCLLAQHGGILSPKRF